MFLGGVHSGIFTLGFFCRSGRTGGMHSITASSRSRAGFGLSTSVSARGVSLSFLVTSVLDFGFSTSVLLAFRSSESFLELSTSGSFFVNSTSVFILGLSASVLVLGISFSLPVSSLQRSSHSVLCLFLHLS